MNDLELRLIHCEKEPSEVALYDAADAHLAVGDEEMYYALKYMADNGKHPWYYDGFKRWYWMEYGYYDTDSQDTDTLERKFFTHAISGCYSEYTFSGIVRWLGKRLIELGMVTA